MSQGNKGVPYPRCLASLPVAVVLTLVAMWRHRDTATHDRPWGEL